MQMHKNMHTTMHKSKAGLVGAACALLAFGAVAQPSTNPEQAWADLQAKAVLNGSVQASVQYLGQEARVFVQSKKRFASVADQARALHAAQLIQRDVAVFCGTHCQVLPMPRPGVAADGRLRFELRFQGLGRQLFEEELQALLSGSTGLPAAASSAAGAAHSPQTKPSPRPVRQRGGWGV